MEFRVNSHTTGSQFLPTVAATTGDGFVVAWSSNKGGSSWDVLGQRYDDSLMPLGDNFVINDYTNDTFFTSIASNDTGEFVASWDGFNAAGTNVEVYGRRYDSAGVPLGGSFQVNSYTTHRQRWSSIALDAAGNFVVVWMSLQQDGWGYGVFGQRYDAAAVPQGGEFVVNTYTRSNERYPAVASHTDGRFVVVWEGSGDSGGYAVWARRYDTLGVAQGLPLRVSEYTTVFTHSGRRNVAMDAQGDFVVAWASFAQDGRSFGVFGRAFDASGTALGGEFAVNVFTTNAQQSPDVSIAPGGRFVVAWWGYDQDGSGAGVFGAALRVRTDLPRRLRVGLPGGVVVREHRRRGPERLRGRGAELHHGRTAGARRRHRGSVRPGRCAGRREPIPRPLLLRPQRLRSRRGTEPLPHADLHRLRGRAAPAAGGGAAADRRRLRPDGPRPAGRQLPGQYAVRPDRRRATRGGGRVAAVAVAPTRWTGPCRCGSTASPWRRWPASTTASAPWTSCGWARSA